MLTLEYNHENAQNPLPSDIQAAVNSQHGGPVAVSGHQGEHVVMTMAVFRDMMGVGSDEEYGKSIDALRISLAQAAAGQTMCRAGRETGSLEEAADKLAQKHGT